MLLTRGDAQLSEADMGLLQPGRWLNDQLIAYFFEGFATSSQGSVLLLQPFVTYMASVLQDSDQLREMLAVPSQRGATSLLEQMGERQLILMPINDKTDPDQHEGGGHWSLLVFRRGGDGTPPRYEHYDSCSNANASHARAAAGTLAKLLQPHSRGLTLKLVAMNSPQQANGFDCGVYVLATAELLCSGGSQEAVAEEIRALTPQDVAARRREFFAQLTEEVARKTAGAELTEDAALCR